MKIQDAFRPAGPSRRHEASGTGGSAFGQALKGQARPAAAAGPATPIAVLDSVLALQEVADPRHERRRAVRRGHDLLAELEDLRAAMMDGALPRATVHHLASLAGSARPAVDDPSLSAVLDEIELRAAVEIAKLEGKDE